MQKLQGRVNGDALVGMEHLEVIIPGDDGVCAPASMGGARNLLSAGSRHALAVAAVSKNTALCASRVNMGEASLAPTIAVKLLARYTRLQLIPRLLVLRQHNVLQRHDQHGGRF